MQKLWLTLLFLAETSRGNSEEELDSRAPLSQACSLTSTYVCTYIWAHVHMRLLGATAVVQVERSDGGANTDGSLGLRKCLPSPELSKRAHAAVIAQAGIKLIFVISLPSSGRSVHPDITACPACTTCPAPWVSWVLGGAL